MRHFEDYRIGTVERFGAYQVTREEVMDFAARFDPSPHHLDDAAAATNPLFGRISASGTHTIAMMTRMLVDHWQQSGQEGMGAPGFSVQFLKPVYPGDTLHCTFEVVDCIPSRSRPQFGAVHFRVAVSNQSGEEVLALTGSSLHWRRESEAE